jgi:hypothetical protein
MTIDSESILDQLIVKYAAFQSFSCVGLLKRIIRGSEVAESCFKMELVYAAPQKICIHWWQVGYENRKKQTLMASHGRVLSCSWPDLTWTEESSIGDALASSAGISNGLTLHIPSLLIGSNIFSLFERIDRIVKLSEADECGANYEIFGYGIKQVERMVKVRAADLAIIAIREKYSIPNGCVECSSTYENISLSDGN